MLYKANRGFLLTLRGSRNIGMCTYKVDGTSRSEIPVVPLIVITGEAREMSRRMLTA